jgi:hypothetical protein
MAWASKDITHEAIGGGGGGEQEQGSGGGISSCCWCVPTKEVQRLM